MEIGNPPYQASNKGGRESLKQRFTAKQLLELDDEAVGSLAPNLALTYYRLKKERSRSRTPNNPESIKTEFKHKKLYEWQ